MSIPFLEDLQKKNHSSKLDLIKKKREEKNNGRKKKNSKTSRII
jgi:hypothetical protein